MLDLIEIKHPREFVFADKVNFILSFSIPPVANFRIAMFFDELGFKIALESKTGEGVEIA